MAAFSDGGLRERSCLQDSCPPLEEFADAHAELCNAPRNNKRKLREVAQALARVYSDHGLMEREPQEEP